MDMELVETQQPRLPDDFAGNPGQRIGLTGVGLHALLQLLEKGMEMHPAFLRQGRGSKHGIQHQTLAATHTAIQIDPGRTTARPARAGTQKRRQPATKMINGRLLCAVDPIASRLQHSGKVAANQQVRLRVGHVGLLLQ